MSDEWGRLEVYVRPFPESERRVQISASGGRRLVWAPDAKRLDFWEGSRLMSATLARDPVVRVASREALFDGHCEVDFDVAKDGMRFLMIESESAGLGLVVVPDWRSELRPLAAARKP